MPDPFREWLKTEEGQRCLDWPVTNQAYLENRLWWAFNAGAKSSQFANSERASDNSTDAQSGTLNE